MDIDQDHEEDSRRSREINIDMQADRRGSFEVARISSPEVSSLSETGNSIISEQSRVCDQFTALLW